MITKRIVILFSILVISTNVVYADDETPDNLKMEPCSGVPAPENKPFPNIFDLVDNNFYELFAEISSTGLTQTFYTKELYNIISGTGRLEIKVKEKSLSTMVYLSDTDETFYVEDNFCETKHVCQSQNFEEYLVERWQYCNKDRKVLGPSAMFYNAYIDSQDDGTRTPVKYCGREEKTVRGMDVFHWSQKLPNGDLMDYYFADDRWASQSLSPNKKVREGSLVIPVRATHTSLDPKSVTGIQNYEIISFLPILDPLSPTDQIPRGVGCKRLKQEYNEKPPSFTNANWYMESEIVYTPSIYSGARSEVTTVKMMYDANAQVFAYQTSPWTLGDNKVKRDDYKIIVYDVQAGLSYTIDEDKGKCTKEKVEVFTWNVTLPSGDQLSLQSEEIFTGNTGYQYLGADKARDIDALVFEKSIKDSSVIKSVDNIRQQITTTRVVTRYTAGESVEYDSGTPEYHVPLQVVIRNYTVKENLDANPKMPIVAEPVHTVSVNVFDFTSRILSKLKEFDMKPCFKKRGQGYWIQVTFPVTAENLMDLWGEMPAVQDAFVTEIVNELEISFLRIGDVIVDYDDHNLYITFFLAERPDVFLEYKKPTKEALLNPDTEESVVTLDECAKSCLSDEGCWGFAYCGSTCSQVEEEPEAKDRSPDKECQLYERYPNDKPMPFVQDLVDDLQFKVLIGDFVLRISTGHLDILQLPATGSVDIIVNGFTGIIHRHEKDVDSFFMRVKSAKKFSDTLKEKKTYGKVSYTECKLACINTDDCESISFCSADSMCVLSTKHGDELTDKDMTKDTQCSIMTRMYTEEYKTFKGLVLNKKAQREVIVASIEKCAKLCTTSSDFDCLSFDYCEEVEEKEVNCYLHVTHLYDSQGKNVKSSQKLKKCSHYSRNFIKDFKKNSGQRIRDSTGLMVFEDVKLDDCASKCIKTGCPSFDFCNVKASKKSQCVIGTKQYSGSELIGKDICSHYEKLQKSLTLKKKEEQQHSNGLAAGLGFLFFFVGGILGAVALFVYGYVKANRS